MNTSIKQLPDKNKILIVNLNWLGDVLFSTPAIRAIRRNFAQAHLACMLVPRVKQVLEGNPHIDELIIYDEDGGHRSLAGKLRFISQLKKKRFDLVFLFHRSFTRTLLTYLAGIPTRIGYRTSKRGFLLNYRIMPPKQIMHRIDYISNIVNAAGIETDNSFCDFFVGKDERDFIDRFLISQGVRGINSVVALNPGGNWQPKRWPKENFSRLADMLMKEFNLKVIITGAQKDMGLAQDICKQMTSKPIIACGQTTLKQLGALFERVILVVSADTSPLHIASSLGTKVIGLFGPTCASITGPRGKGYIKLIQKDIGCPIPCYDTNCRDYRCMKAITPKQVAEEVRKALNL